MDKKKIKTLALLRQVDKAMLEPLQTHTNSFGQTAVTKSQLDLADLLGTMREYLNEQLKELG